ncbi:MAG: hypothetical protein MI864_09830, partial [Pseudomonadales bacterium]|nr:hypothetical protein [Pseudomonadales bacterium]
ALAMVFSLRTSLSVEIFMTDGAKITIAISEPGRSKGILRACNDLSLCRPFGDIPFAILKAIGKESEAL